MQLNPDQLSVVEHFKGRAFVIAGPGSGKTGTLKERIGRLLDRGVLPQHILVLTFTNKASDEMKKRLAETYGQSVELITGCTFHSLCVRILREYGDRLGYSRHMTVLDSKDQEAEMSKLIRQKFAHDEEFKISIPQIKTICGVCNDIRENLQPLAMLNDYLDTGTLKSTEEADIIRDYIKKLRTHNQCDFSGLLSETVKLLRDDEDLRAMLQARYKFIQVDEYQDTNVSQNALVELLAGAEDNVVAVGDLDQSIYQWRGASPDNVKNFINAGKGKNGCGEYVLGVNYRSTPEIISVADKLIRNIPDRRIIEFTAHNPPNGFPPVLNTFANPDEEAAHISNEIEKFIGKGVSPKQIAILYRLNDMGRPIEQALMRKKIPYRVIGGPSYYDRQEIRDCMSMLRLIVNPKDGTAFNRVVSRLAIGIGEKTVGAIENFAQANNINLIQACSRAGEFCKKGATESVLKAAQMFHLPVDSMPAPAALQEILKRTNYVKWIEEHEPEKEKANSRQRNVQSMVNDIASFTDRYKDAGLPEYLQYITLLTSSDDKEKGETVTLMSGHASKGSEYDAVFVIGCEHKFYPHERAVLERPDFGFQEELRLLYVMFTRAKKLLRVSWCKNRSNYGGRPEVRMPSKFLAMAGLISDDDFEKHIKIQSAVEEFTPPERGRQQKWRNKR